MWTIVVTGVLVPPWHVWPSQQMAPRAQNLDGNSGAVFFACNQYGLRTIWTNRSVSPDTLFAGLYILGSVKPGMMCYEPNSELNGIAIAQETCTWQNRCKSWLTHERMWICPATGTEFNSVQRPKVGSFSISKTIKTWDVLSIFCEILFETILICISKSNSLPFTSCTQNHSKHGFGWIWDSNFATHKMYQSVWLSYRYFKAFCYLDFVVKQRVRKKCVWVKRFGIKTGEVKA